MKIIGIYNELHPGITMHKIPVKAGFPGLLFTIGMMAVYLMGIPALSYFLLLAIVLGIGVAVMLRFIPPGRICDVRLHRRHACVAGWSCGHGRLAPGTRDRTEVS